MELKKSEKADLQKKRVLFLEIGFVVTLLLVIGMFAINFKDRSVDYSDDQIGDPFEEEIIENTIQDQRTQPVRQQIQVMSEIINIVKDDTKITTDMKFDDWVDDAIIVPESSNRIGDITDFGDDYIFEVLENEPLFQGKHMSTFVAWVQSNAKYPEAERRAGVQGRVQVRFVIEKDGSLSNIEVVNSPNEALSAEAVRVISSSPKWTPGMQRQKPVRFAFTIPVLFRLGK